MARIAMSAEADIKDVYKRQQFQPAGGRGRAQNQPVAAIQRARKGIRRKSPRAEVHQRAEMCIRDRLGLDLQNGFFLAQHALIHQIDGDLESSSGGTLAVTRCV